MLSLPISGEFFAGKPAPIKLLFNYLKTMCLALVLMCISGILVCWNYGFALTASHLLQAPKR
jgi:hypothetical protein